MLHASTRSFRWALASAFAGFGLTAQAQTATDPATLAQAIEAQRQQIDALQQQLNQLLQQQKSQPASTAQPVIAPSTVTAGYNNGYFIKDASGDNALYVNGLLQPRFTWFSTDGTDDYGATDADVSNFDVFLGRLYFSGNVVDPSYGFFVTLQGSTTGNGSGLTLLDAEVSKTFSPAFKIEAGRYWSAYTYEYYDDIGKYLVPDLSAAEWAFSLGRQNGVRVSGKLDRVSYNWSVSNTIPGSDVGQNNNLHGDLATALNFYVDILEPYGYQETNPGGSVSAPQLSLWVSGMYNPVEYDSVFQNDLAGDKTSGATASLNFRYGLFSFQGSGYYKHNDAASGSNFDSHGWQEQAGYYLVPSKFELVQRVDQVNWGRGQIAATGGKANTWYAGPGNFSYEQLTEYTLGFNYYLAGHRAKLQFAYSYLDGEGFDGGSFEANRLLTQVQLAF